LIVRLEVLMPTREDLENVERYFDTKAQTDPRPWIRQGCNEGKSLTRELLSQTDGHLSDDEDTLERAIEIVFKVTDVEG
jgi:hypothetical protein